jgi:hypothetical protein
MGRGGVEGAGHAIDHKFAAGNHKVAVSGEVGDPVGSRLLQECRGLLAVGSDEQTVLREHLDALQFQSLQSFCSGGSSSGFNLALDLRERAREEFICGFVQRDDKLVGLGSRR